MRYDIVSAIVNLSQVTDRSGKCLVLCDGVDPVNTTVSVTVIHRLPAQTYEQPDVNTTDIAVDNTRTEHSTAKAPQTQEENPINTVTDK